MVGEGNACIFLGMIYDLFIFGLHYTDWYFDTCVPMRIPVTTSVLNAKRNENDQKTWVKQT